ESHYIEIFPRCIRHIQTAGEQVVISERFAGYLKQHGVYLHNHYGPSETHVVTALTLEPSGEIPQLPSIGKPVANTMIYILDNHMNIQPVGVSGELYIGGVQVGRGYLNNPELTAERFGPQITLIKLMTLMKNKINKSFSGVQGAVFQKSPLVLYKTGDLARWLPDAPPAGGGAGGVIEFLGRIDHQIKIRGFRVELGEIESQLLTHRIVKEAVVAAKKDNKGDGYLCAYIVPADDKEFTVPVLRQFLSGKLPDYMIPGYFVLLERLPLTPSGKVDQKALPQPGFSTVPGEYTAPHGDIEEKLAGIWSDLLGIEKINISTTANFFAYGGHSLKATIMAARIHKELNIQLPLVEIFKKTTIKELSEYIKELTENKYISLEPAEKKEYYDLSSVQKRLYVLRQLDEQGFNYNLPSVSLLEGNLDKNRLEKTFRYLLARHESLRTSFSMVGTQPVQEIHEQVEFAIEYYDSTGENGKNHTPRHFIHSFIRPFDLSMAPLLRASLIKMAEIQHILIVDMHHIITDGTSMDLFIKESLAFYAGEELPPLKFQYKDYIQWQNSDRQKQSLRAQEQFWINQFAEEAAVLDWPLDYPRPAVQRFEGNAVAFELNLQVTQALKQMTRDTGATPYMVLLAIYNILLSKISGQEDVVVGTPVAARRHTDLERIIGMFVNTLALRNYPKGEKTFREFLIELKDTALQAFENQEYPFEDLVEKIFIRRDLSRNPIFDVMFALQNTTVHTTDYKIPGLIIKPYESEHRMAKFDLSLTCFEVEDIFRGSFEYCTQLFKKKTIERFIIYFKQIIAHVIDNPIPKMSQIEIITPAEKQQILFDFNDTVYNYPWEKTLPGLLAEQVERTPDNIALHGCMIAWMHDCMDAWMDGDGGEEEKRRREEEKRNGIHLSYRELNEQADRLAGILRENGAGPGCIVGIMIKRSLELITGIWGILIAGGAYLPIDPEYPKDRIDYMLKDSAAKVLVINKSEIRNSKFETNPNDQNTNDPNKNQHFGAAFVLNFENLNLNSIKGCPRRGLQHSASCILHSNHLAYIIYTSGSTGKPKGVIIKHKNVVNFIHGITARITFTPGKSILALTTVSFDIFVLETLLPLVKGLRVVMAGEDQQKDPRMLAHLISKESLEMLQMTPSGLRLLSNGEAGLSCLKHVSVLIVGGESFPADLFQSLKVAYKGRLYNMYGPTETTVWSSVKDLTGAAAVDIGRPIANTYLYIVNRYNQLLPSGIAGELCIGGDGVSSLVTSNNKNFHNENPSNFPNDQCPMTNDRFYKTGDLARWLEDGNVDCLGRIDQQIKIRGFRVELGEIEKRLLTYPQIKEAVVAAVAEETGDKYLCAYIVPAVELDISVLRDYLTRHLPGYMIPAYFVLLDKIPLTPNGKIDRKALPLPQLKDQENKAVPRDEIELKLAALWAEVLNLEKNFISIDSSFFQLGGHSLKATLLTARIHKDFNIVLPLAEFFKTPTIRDLAEYLRKASYHRYGSIFPAEKKEYYELSPAQERLYILQQMEPEST
ncbi:MAG: amino acid adenylation domain-containing protein, partial [Acidobacteria bacterium]|nr:amino acid adenylation domain-containing protein [Acidobacteriota bacterium]